MEGMENRHSNVLAWLLSPRESHGLGDRFVKAFLAESLKSAESPAEPNALDVIQADLNDIEVRREWLRTDLFLLSPRNRWAFIIENKFRSKQRHGQLSEYVAKVRSAYAAKRGDLKIRGIFLTLNDEPAADQAYVPIGYEAVAELIMQAVRAEGRSLGQEVRIFIEHYVDIINEVTGMSVEQNKMQELAQALYQKHHKVLDFIWENSFSNSFLLARREVFGDDWGDGKEVHVGDQNREVFISFWSGTDRFSFLPKSWYDELGGRSYRWPGCENWWRACQLSAGLSWPPVKTG